MRREISSCRGRRFNPRAREGRDLDRNAERRDSDVSIHAPARGATVLASFLGNAWVFQSTRPRGARRLAALNRRMPHCFNPRAREGRDFLSKCGWFSS